MRFWSRLSVPIVILILLILVGTYSYHAVEGWRYLDSLYFTVVTITTIGYGDFAPATDTGKIITIIFPFLGIGLAFYLFSLLGRFAFSKHMRERLKVSGRLNGKRGVKRVRK
jgi:hypothetical protein